MVVKRVNRGRTILTSRVRETLVLGEEGPPKTVGSNRDIDMMIYEHYYTYIKDYERDEGKVFMERVYLPETKKSAKSTPILPQEEVRGKGNEPNPLISL